MQAPNTRRMKIASISMNQTVYDYAVNIRNILKGVDLAVADHTDLLATEELSLTGYAADDYHHWNKNNDTVWTYLNLIARYAEKKDPNLVLTIGAPWHYANKSNHVTDPAYNINGRPFNSHFIITGGHIVAISAKSILADGPAEYEARQFNSWPLSKGTINITLPDGTSVPFGKPIVFLQEGLEAVSLANEICAEGWPGVHEDLSINQREMNEARHIVLLARNHDLSIVLNPSASKPQPAINKERIRANAICKTGSLYCGVYVYTNFLGSSSGTYAAEGSRLFAQSGSILYHGQRYSFKDVSYSSATIDVPIAQRGTPSTTVAHTFADRQSLETKGEEADFDKAFAAKAITIDQLSYEEYMRSIALWLRDYISKPNHQSQGYVISLSGGKDSAYGALAVSLMIDLDIKENGLEAFLDRFKDLKYKDTVLKIYREQGLNLAIDDLKRNFLTCLYLPTENSSEEDEKAARFLIEGGTHPDGRHVKGIGGKFYVAPVQAMLEEAIIAYTGLNLNKVVQENMTAILDGKYSDLTLREQTAIARDRAMQMIHSYVNATVSHLPSYITSNCINRIPTWANPADDLTLQNIQARIRLPIPWAVANQEGKIALVTSNESEAVHSYTTAGGDMHMGGANPIGGVPKHVITKSLAYFETYGLAGLSPIPSLFLVNASTPSARLRKKIVGIAEQTDEKDLGFTYEQSQFIEQRLLERRQTPLEVLPQMRTSDLFPKDLPTLRNIILNFTKRWESGQFKRIMGTLAPHVGSNVDPHQAIRTTVLGDHFHTSCAYMVIEIIAELSGGSATFQQKFGITPLEAKTAAGINSHFRTALLTQPMDRLMDPTQWQSFNVENGKFLLFFSPSPNEAVRRAAHQFTSPLTQVV